MTIEEIRAFVRRLDPKLEETDKAFDAAVLLAALCEENLSWEPAALAAFTEIPEKRVAAMVKRLRAQGVMTDDNEIDAEWWDEETGAVAFWLDCGVALGHIKRSQIKH